MGRDPLDNCRPSSRWAIVRSMSEPKSALVVDDERDIRELLVLTLGRMGLRISTAANLAE
ncbi:sigma-54-dependent Fis family transcriptional regulator, partial [Xanthomonas vasicola]